MVDLSGIPALDLAIGLSFIFFVLAVLASGIQELLASALGLRARTLEQGLRSLLEDPDKGWKLVDEFYDHALIKSLYRTPPPRAVTDAAEAARLKKRNHGNYIVTSSASTGEDKDPAGRNAHIALRNPLTRALAFFKRTSGPSYISPRSFAAVLLDGVAPAEASPPDSSPPIGVEDLIGDLPEAVRERLQPLVDEAGDDVAKFRKSVEALYDDTMARVSGWYKRKSQVILIVIGIALVPAVNANALAIGQRLWTDKAVRTAVLAQASAATPTDGKVDKARLKEAAEAVNGVQAVGVPLGWRGDAVPNGTTAWITAVLGWILAICAISLGAPFWFDALGRLSRLRSSGKPETPLPATGSGKRNERVET